MMKASEEYKKDVMKSLRMVLKNLECNEGIEELTKAANHFKEISSVNVSSEYIRNSMIKYFNSKEQEMMCEKCKLALARTKKGVLSVSTK